MKAQINHFYKFLVIILITIFLVTGIKTVFASIPNVNELLKKAEMARLNGFYISATETLTQAKEILDKQPNSLQKAEVLRKLGNMLRLVGDIGKLDEFKDNQCQVMPNSKLTSIQVLKESLDIANRINDNNGINWALFYLGHSARAINEKYKSVNDETQATKAHNITLDCYNKVLSSQNLDDDFTVRVQLNKLSFEINNQNISQLKIDAINDKITKLPLNNTKINARINLVKSLIKFPESQEITTKFKAEILGKAIAESRQIKDNILESYAVGYLGNLYEQNQQYDQAIELTNQAIKLLLDKEDNLHIQYLWEWQLGRLYEQKEDIKSAIAAYTRAFNYLEYLKQDLVSLNPDVQYSFKEEVEPVYRGLVNLLLQDNPSQDNLKTAIDVMDKLQIAELNNFFRKNCITAKPKDIKKIIKKDEALIYPIVLKDRIEVILYLSDQGFSHYTNKLGNEFSEIIKRFGKNLLDPNSYLGIFQNYSKQLYPFIISPEMRTKLDENKITKLVFILDTKLQNIPMATLYDGEKYLIQDFKIAISPSLNIFEPQLSSNKSQKILLGGLSHKAPSFDLPAVKVFKFEGLGSVKNELENIKKYIEKKINVIGPLENEEFTEKNIELSIANNPTIIHFATHGKFSSDPEETFILTENELLDINKLKSLIKSSENKSIPIELLVLSACETAKGDKRATLGLAGIAVRSGARSTLASLWNINDPFTAEFMDKFYQKLIIEKNSKSAALQIVQNEFLKGNNDEFKKPYYWGAFVLIGNWL